MTTFYLVLAIVGLVFVLMALPTIVSKYKDKKN